MLAESKFSKYLIYAVGEIVLVVIGILIALQLNTYAENKKLNDTRQAYYRQLVDDLNKDIRFSNEIIKRLETNRKAYSDYLAYFESEDLKPIGVYNELMKLNILSDGISFNSNTIESLRSSGELILFPLELRNKLLDLLLVQDALMNSVERNDGGKADVLMNLGLIRGASTLIGRLENKPQLKADLNIEQSLPQIILGLEAAHKWKDLSEQGTIKKLKSITAIIEGVIDLIESEMKE
jgi:hypothetical protein